MEMLRLASLFIPEVTNTFDHSLWEMFIIDFDIVNF